MAYAMTKQGSRDNVITYEFMCDTLADMNAIESEYRTLGSIAIVLQGESEALEVYICDSTRQWIVLNAGGSSNPETGGSLSIYICAQNEVDNGLPDIAEPDENTIYLVPAGETSGNLYEEYIYVNEAWEKFGAATIDLSNYATEDYVNAAMPDIATNVTAGLVKIPNQDRGLELYGDTNDIITIRPATEAQIKAATNYYCPIGPARQYISVFYGLAKAAGDNTQSVSNNAVGTYTADAKAAIRTMIEAAPVNSPNFTGNISMGRLDGSTVGTLSVATGNSVVASGSYSHAEGMGYQYQVEILSYTDGTDRSKSNQTLYVPGAAGLASHIEGKNTRAGLDYSHAEGYQTFANAEAAHTEGGYTLAAGSGYQHAEGFRTAAIGAMGEHAEGAYTYVSGSGGGHVEGLHSYAVGQGAQHAEGYYTQASGGYGTHAEGGYTLATGSGYSHAEGYKTISSSEASHAEGGYTLANQQYAHAEGYATIAQGAGSHAEGYGSYTTTNNGNIIQNGPKATAQGAHAEGYGQILASGRASHAEGDATQATGVGSHAEGLGGTYTVDGVQYTAGATQSYAHAEGAVTHANSYAAHAEGYYTRALGYASHAEGNGTVAKDAESHAEGYKTIAESSYAHAEGDQTIARGVSSHAEGYKTIAVGAHSHVSGMYNIEDSYDSWTVWTENTQYNVGDKIKISITNNNNTVIKGYHCNTAHTSGSTFNSTYWTQDAGYNYLEIIGNGSADNARSNARALTWTGDERLAGDVYVHCNNDSTGGTKLVTITELTALTNRVAELESEITSLRNALNLLNVPENAVRAADGTPVTDEALNYVEFDEPTT